MVGDDPLKQALEKAVCANDILHWCKYWVWTDDPREEFSLRPFDLFPHQEEFLLWLKEREQARKSGLAEKSRDVGFTWLCIAYAVHGLIFRRGFKAGFGSRKLDLVDKLGDPDTIFEKGRILLRNLPVWMLPKGWSEQSHAGYCKFLNREIGSSITGEGGDQIGRGGRKTIYLVDESAFLAHPELIEKSLSATTNVRIDVSTPNGPGNAFARKRHGGKVAVFTFHWTQDPRKTQEWAIDKQSELDEVTWAQEYNLDYNASIEGICVPAKYVRAAVELIDSSEFKAAYPKFLPQGEVTAGYDVAGGGKNKNVVIGRQSLLVLMPESWGQLGPTQSAWKAAHAAEAMNAVTMHYDAIGVGLGTQDTYNMAVAADADKPKTQRLLQFTPNAVNVGDPPSERVWPSGRTAKEMFRNKRAELWWTMRERCRKAYEFRVEGIPHPPEEMISLPQCAELIAQLSMPLAFENETGKIQLESKIDMAKRGVASPDFGDALALTMEPTVNWSEPAQTMERAKSEFAGIAVW